MTSGTGKGYSWTIDVNNYIFLVVINKNLGINIQYRNMTKNKSGIWQNVAGLDKGYMVFL